MVLKQMHTGNLLLITNLRMSPASIFPQSNSEAERVVSTITKLLKKEGDPYPALLAYCSTPLEIGYSPSQHLMNRVLCTTVPNA